LTEHAFARAVFGFPLETPRSAMEKQFLILNGMFLHID